MKILMTMNTIAQLNDKLLTILIRIKNIKFLKAKHEYRDCNCCLDGDGTYNYFIGIDLMFLYSRLCT